MNVVNHGIDPKSVSKREGSAGTVIVPTSGSW
jgi:hypothetical protein